MSEKIKIGISSCLLGNNVRYDGGHKLDLSLRDDLGLIVEWVPVCPEVESGLGVPREPMQLNGDPAAPRLIAIETKTDRTDDLMRLIEKKLPQLEQQGIRGFVFKARSPSCGVHDTPLLTLTGGIAGVRAGLFAEAVIRCFPAMPVEDEERLRDPVAREDFIKRIKKAVNHG
ncbi:MAG TPA: DUF523 domain-containing protein [Nitrospirota bacterium]|jgi:uncharacterized protein YbbK (DUF523 family)|nr:DUF523 domain-containing protein [Nitrospirota bacterium]